MLAAMDPRWSSFPSLIHHSLPCNEDSEVSCESPSWSVVTPGPTDVSATRPQVTFKAWTKMAKVKLFALFRYGEAIATLILIVMTVSIIWDTLGVFVKKMFQEIIRFENFLDRNARPKIFHNQIDMSQSIWYSTINLFANSPSASLQGTRSGTNETTIAS